jgi:pimeloyl-ACP methyl ester carboxylesterase
MTRNPTSRDAVVLVHGLAANQLVMAPLARVLGRAYSRVVNWGYSSLWSPIERHGQRLAALIKGLEEQAERIHIVTHSMGGIITRLALAEHEPRRLGRLVMVAPPNRGSHVATWLAPWLGRIIPPIEQLADQADSFVCRLPLPKVPEVGVIAAAADFLVREPSTHLEGETDHITLPGLHSSLLWRRETAEQVQHFLEHGRFHRAAPAKAAA